jgi:cell wall-associated NlpC family hydrolase
MLSRFLPVPVIFFMIIGFTIGIDFERSAQARTNNSLTTPVETVKKHIETEQTIQKTHSTSKQAHKAKTAKKTTKKKDKLAKKKTKIKTAGKSAKKAHIAKNSPKKKQAHSAGIAKNKNHKKTKVARHKAGHKHHRYAKRAKAGDAQSVPAGDGKRKIDPVVDLWLTKDAPEKFRQGMNDEELDELTLSILESAFSYLGTPYRYGGTSPEGFDCSGFVQHVFNENGISLGRTSRDQALEGSHVSLYDLRPGDLIFFNMRNRRSHIDHVGLYIGKGQFIHASSDRHRKIAVEKLDTNLYLPRMVEARRVFDNPQ